MTPAASEVDAVRRRIRDQAVLHQINVLLDTATELGVPGLSAENGGQPADGSPMALDIDQIGEAGPALVQRATFMAHMVSTETLNAVQAVHTWGCIAFAPGPMLRCVIEHSARIAWLINAPDARTRMIRAHLVFLVAYGEDKKTNFNAGNGTPAMVGAPERLDHFRDVQIAEVFDGAVPNTSSRDPNQWTLLGEQLPAHTDATEQLFRDCVNPRFGGSLDGRVQYRIASMFTHPSVTATSALGDFSEAGSATFRWSASLTRTRTVAALLAYAGASACLLDYLGWETPYLVPWAEQLRHFIEQTADLDT